MNDHVTLMEVGPRDGLQGEKVLPVATRLALIKQLLAAGCRHIEVGSFVNPKRVPQMADTAELFPLLPSNTPARFSALAANSRGLEQALTANADAIALFTATSDTFCQRNIGMDSAQSVQQFRELAAHAQTSGLPVRGYVSTTIACPYEGKTAPAKVAKLAYELHRAGCYEVSLGDTIGVGTPRQVKAMLQAVLSELPASAVAVHFHDTYGQALANVCCALELGIRTVDASVAGLGGCPYAPGASGNLASEDLIYLLNGLGMNSGVDLPLLVAAGEFISQQLDKPACSKVNQAMRVSVKQTHSDAKL
ncbi:hydroxymethylglutaryl-CoA lyase [Corallincola holothuriorum]|uniref:hydroxymethylglutaryl-CoA lyase n=1 Tax=Corallincola holothuriorum TaxID=2282215 RepID=A0A368NIN2_9GAMM|nr:hydroxymethylglutaryl-CoA lyase [Corallincola holothuriorum]RCU49615.1 hydroxymethylglutaryl-CoA lyase [Corallincola holothuriorum]